ncbi:phage portal protein [Brachymonas sp.]|uniref:phage portal protein n=1 Tax=Brachymonas sp. TaxID=1936292 RepID=UPI0035B0A82A
MKLSERIKVAARFVFRNEGNGAAFFRSSDPRVLEMLGPMPAAAGVYVTPETAQRVSAVYACVDRIAGGISSLPCEIYRREGAVRRQVHGHPLWYLLNEQACDAWTSATHWHRTLQYVLLRGDSFALIKRNAAGAVVELVPLPWESVVTERDTLSVDARNIYMVNDGYRAIGYDQDDVLHFPGYGFNGVRSMSVLSWGARNAAGNAMAMDEYSGRFFADGAHPSIVITTDKVMKQEQIDELQRQVGAKHSGVNNAHKTPLVLTEGLKAQEISISAQDAQLLEARKFQVVDIARAFGVPPHLIGETSASTSWGSGIESMTRSFSLFTLKPHLTRIEQELNRKLFRRSNLFVEFDRDAMVQGDLQAQAKYYRAAIGGPGNGPGWMTVNEVRQKQYLPPSQGWDEIFTPAESGAPAPATE